MCTHERSECPGLVPPHKQLGRWVVKEATNVGAGEGDTRDTDSEDHWVAGSELVPRSHVITYPNGAMALRTRKEDTEEDEGSSLVMIFQLPFPNGTNFLQCLHSCIGCELDHLHYEEGREDQLRSKGGGWKNGVRWKLEGWRELEELRRWKNEA